MKHFFATHGLNILRLFLIVAFGFVVFTIINLQRDNHDILIHVKQQQDTADRAAQDLKDDNAQQTVILCTLILSNNVEVKPEDASKIEAICKEKIEQAADPKVPASDAGATFTPDFTQLNQADPTPEQEMHVQPPTKPETPKPPVDEGLIPDNIPVVGKLL